jgi:hypothetical protein
MAYLMIHKESKDMSGEMNSDWIAGSWIVDGGPGQMKLLAVYSPLGGGKYSAVESAVNFDWTLGGAQPTATHGTTTSGVVEVKDGAINFVLITYALDDSGKAVYLIKGVGNKVFIDPDTISVQNLVMYFYTQPETANPVSDPPDFCVPPSGTFPPVPEYRIKVS